MDLELILYIAIGFLAQLVDGALGMAYGILATTLLASTGLPFVSASASVHTAEIGTTAVAGLAHTYRRNIEWTLVGRLAVWGSVGAVLGAFALSYGPPAVIRPLVATYLIVMGILVAAKAWRKSSARKRLGIVSPLGFIGGLIDSMGGGGWGPVVVSNLIARASSARIAIGSACVAEFFVTTAASAAFVYNIGFEFSRVVVGLLIGGVLAAPLSAWLVGKLPEKLLFIFVGVLIVTVSAIVLITALRN